MSRPHFDADADQTVQTVAGGGGVIYQIVGNNEDGSSTFYLQLFGVTNPTVGTTAPLISLPLEPGAFGFHFGDKGVQLATAGVASSGLSYAVTTTPTGSTGPGSNVSLNLLYG